MNLRIFFDPIPEDVLPSEPGAGSWQQYVMPYSANFPSLEGVQIALIGVPDCRGAGRESSDINGLRQKLYALKKGAGSYNIVDLGDLRNGETYEDTANRLREVCSYLIDDHIVPVVIGGSHDICCGQFFAYDSLDRTVTMVNIDGKVDIESTGTADTTFLNRILTYEPNFLFHYSQLGYQTYLVSREALETLEKLYFELYRIGHIRDNFEEAEPVIRAADLVTFDLAAIRQTEAPGTLDPQPFGFTGEEACQLAWYAGITQRVSSMGFYGFYPDSDDKDQTAGVLATMIWYFVEGFYHRASDFDPADPRYTRYIVALKEEPHRLVFYKDTVAEKWWLEVPPAKDSAAEPVIIPCSYKDYKSAGKGEIPNRWILTQAKLS